MGATEKSLFLRQQLNVHLPTHMHALIQFNLKQSWDDLLVVLDQASPHVDVSLYNYASQTNTPFKQEPLELNATTVAQKSTTFTGLCNYCKKPGHKIANCFKREQANSRNNKPSKPNGTSSNNSSSFNSRNNNSNSRNLRNQNNRQNTSCSRPFGSNDRSACPSSNTLLLYPDDSDSAEVSTLELEQHESVIDITSLLTATPLLFRTITGSLRSDNENFKLKALLDCGATNCFVRFACLPIGVRRKIEEFKRNGKFVDNSQGLKKRTFTIRGATSSAVECCVIATIQISMRVGLWEHDFIVTEKILEKDMIIGRDFMALYNVVIHNGQDLITINKPVQPVRQRSEESEGSVPKKSEQKSTVDNFCVLLDHLVLEPRTGRTMKCRVSESFVSNSVLFNPDTSRGSH